MYLFLSCKCIEKTKVLIFCDSPQIMGMEWVKSRLCKFPIKQSFGRSNYSVRSTPLTTHHHIEDTLVI